MSPCLRLWWVSGIRAVRLAFRCRKVQAHRRRVSLITTISPNRLNRLHCIMAAVCPSPPFPFDGRRGCRTVQHRPSEAAPPPDVGSRSSGTANPMPAESITNRPCCACGGSGAAGVMISDIFDITASCCQDPASTPLRIGPRGRMSPRQIVTKMANPRAENDIFAFRFTPKSIAADRNAS